MESFSLSSNVYKCNFGMCCKSSSTITEAVLHSKLHSTNGRYHCDLCFYTVSKLSLFKKHQLLHSCDLLFGCTQCTHKARSKADLSRHIKRHLHTTPVKLIQRGAPSKRGRPIKSTLGCQYDDCEYQGMNKDDLLNHVKLHINPGTARNILQPEYPNMLEILVAVAIEADIATPQVVESDTTEPKNIDVEHFDLINPTEFVQPILAELVEEDSKEVDNRSAEDPDYVD